MTNTYPHGHMGGPLIGCFYCDHPQAQHTTDTEEGDE